jgi:galactitol-specific phosphotransferase system IIC component
MALPFVFIIIFGLLVMLESRQNFEDFMALKQSHNDCFEVLPATSAELMKQVLLITSGTSVVLENRFKHYLRQLELNV